ncbi:hypothetical protein Glove_116g4 [Diversispora epigaea]|uniref:Uncharacterized protein n=1 Tax=Diversispora epigaea TaxID=1348612 RepID=A0A397J0W3_9GLOM|nr:hypothetical protein Glove_116g4 [Diversispora epigaea]
MESKSDPKNETISSIYSILQNTYQFELITVYLHFISIYAKAFVHDLDFFQQQKKPVFPFVETRLVNLIAYLESNRTAIYFGVEIKEVITNLCFNPSEFYPIFQDIFQVAYKKFEAHSKLSNSSSISCNEFNNPSDNLLHE